MSHIAPQIHEKTAAEIRNIAVDFRGKLDSGELLSGTPTVTGSADLTLSSKLINTADLEILGEAVAIGEAVQFQVSGGVAGTSYPITITVSTDGDPAQTLVAQITLNVV